MTKVLIDSGICGMVTTVTAHSEDGETVRVTAESPCPAVKKMMEDLGEEFDVFEACMIRPGTGPAPAPSMSMPQRISPVTPAARSVPGSPSAWRRRAAWP